MRECERDGPQPVKHPQDGQARPDGVSRLHTDQARRLPLLMDLLQGHRVVDEGQVVRVLSDEPLNKVDLL